jgi:polyferredoxin
VQWATAALVVAIGVQFTFWVRAHLEGTEPAVGRPPGVEAFLPINSMLAARHLLGRHVIDPIHPAGLAIFLGVCLMSAVVARSFCSHLCPVGLVSELLGRLGLRSLGRDLKLPVWVDVPLRSLKWLLLAFFAWAVWFAMSPGVVAAFLQSPYARVADVKMWLFFAEPSRTTVAVLAVLVVLSLLVRDFWCRYLCPYGALLGALGRLAPFKVRRDPSLCTDCRACTRVCPARLPVHRLRTVASVECTACQDCVVACKVRSCLAVRSPSWAGAPLTLGAARAVAVAGGLYLAVVLGFRLTGHWRTAVTDTEYRERLRDIDSPAYDHFGSRRAARPGPAERAARRD